MKDNSSLLTPEAPVAAGPSPASGQFPLPTAQRTRRRLIRAWLIGLTIFGYGPAFTYGWLAWLFNEKQWFWTYLLYFTEVPLVGGFFVLVLPTIWFQPIYRALNAWTSGQPVDRAQCALVYERALQLPWRVALGACAAGTFGYLVGMTILHQMANQPWIEIAKTFPAIPLTSGMMGAFCYFGTARALYPVTAWCSVQLRYARPSRHVTLAEKFLTTTCVLAVAALCLLQPAAYSLGQVVTERHMRERVQYRLATMAYRARSFERPEDEWTVLKEASIGGRGYVFAIDPSGNVLTQHPRGYTHIDQERFYCAKDRWGAQDGQWGNCLQQRLQAVEGSWVDRFGQHRVIAYLRQRQPNRMLVAVAYPSDFAVPLSHFVKFSWVVMLEVLFVVFLFGRYFTRGITTPLADLTKAVQRITEHNDLSQHVPVTTNDELGDVARAFNRMVNQLQASQADLRDYTKRLERSAQELSALNQEMEDLLRVVSHDLRAPLINIQGFSKRLEPLMAQTMRTLQDLTANGHLPAGHDKAKVDEMRATVESKFAESLRFIAKSIEKMDTLLSSLLAVSRVGRKADLIQTNDLNDVLDDVLANFEHQLKDAAIQIIRKPLPNQVPCRRNEINQVFSNLVSNAINYMGPTGRRFIEIGGAADAERAECYVRDTGIGIAPEDHDRVFQMFMRLQAVDVPGEGVGLAYVKKILRSHGGTIRVESQRGQGSTFTFTLPMQPVGAAPKGVT